MLEELIEERKKKLDKFKEAGIDPYPARTKRTHEIAEVLKGFSALGASKKRVSVVGRILGLRDMGNVVFFDLADESGKIQIIAKKNNLLNFTLLKTTIDRGDFVSVGGSVFKTKSGEKSIEAKEYMMLAKSLRPLPDKWTGLEDLETRLRARYLDLLMNPETAELFRKKAVFWDAFREYLKQKNFLEVDMSALESIPGGAEAEPFVTHHNALNEDFYLRISLELPLKKLLVGGYEKVFEIARIFRNEGIDREHLQDYTQLEFYMAYNDYRELMKMIEALYKNVVRRVTGGLITSWEGKKINWGKKWKQVEYVAAFKKTNNMDPLEASHEALVRRAKEVGAKLEPHMGRGRLIDLIFKKTVRSTLVEPCFLINPPVEVEPLAKRLPNDPRLVERVQVVACGTELGKGFSELNDPLDQRARFEEQMKLRAAGDKEAQQLDEDFLESLEYGMPPAAGFGVSERLFAILMDKPVRETVIFPLMRKKS